MNRLLILDLPAISLVALLLGACAAPVNPVTDQTYRGGKGDVAANHQLPVHTLTQAMRDPCRVLTDRTLPASIFDECGGDDVTVTPTIPTPTVPGPVDPVVPVDPVDPTDPVDPPCTSKCGGGGPKGNASGNNGKGGNYDHTGHEDNGKGNGKGRR